MKNSIIGGLVIFLSLLFVHHGAFGAFPDVPSDAPKYGYIRFSEKSFFQLFNDKDHVYIHFEPYTSKSYICGRSFTIVQNGVQMDARFMEEIYEYDSYFSAFCGDLYVPTTFRLLPESAYSSVFKSDEPFTLIYENTEAWSAFYYIEG